MPLKIRISLTTKNIKKKKKKREGQVMTMKLLSPSSASNPRWAKSLFLFTCNPKGSEPISNSTNFFNGGKKI